MSTRVNVAHVAGGRVVANLGVLVRGVVLARMIGPENMGIAATFMASIAFVDMISFLGPNRFLIQDPEGCEQKTVRVVQLITLARGIVFSALMLAAAWPMSRIMEADAALLGYFLVALVPAVRGMQSLDWALQQRAHRPRAHTIMVIGAEWGAVAIGVAVALITGSWWASAAAIVTQAVVATVISHMLARTPWSVGFDGQVARRVFRFGLPLLPSGILLFLAMQGDRLAVGVADSIRGVETYSLADLGRYAIVANLAALPNWVCTDLTYGVFLPWLSGTRDSRLAARRHGDLVLLYGSLGVLMAFSAATIGGSVISFIVGPRFGEVAGLIAIFGVAQALSILRSTANVAAMAAGDSRNTLIGGVGRSIGFVLAVVAVFQGLPLEVVAGCAIVGEILGLLCAQWSLARSHRSRIGPPSRMAGFVLALLLAAAVGWVASRELGPWTGFATLGAAAGLLVGLGCAISPSFRARIGGLAALALRGRGASRAEG